MLTSVFANLIGIDLLLRKMNGEIDSFELDEVHEVLVIHQRHISPALEIVNLEKSLEYPGVVLLADLPERHEPFFTKYFTIWTSMIILI